MDEGGINQRVIKFFDDNKMEYKATAIKLGVEPQRIQQWKNNLRQLTLENLIRLCSLHPNLNARWLLTGEGEMVMQAVEKPYQVKDEKLKIVEDGCAMCAEKDKRVPSGDQLFGY